MPWVKQESCVGCKLCIAVCPIDSAIIMQGEKAYIVQEKCINCHKCIEKCPADSIRPNSENPLLRGMKRGGGRGMGRGSGRRMERRKNI